MVPEVVRWLSAFRQTGLPAASDWQIIPGAQRAEAVTVAEQVFEPEAGPSVMKEQTDVDTIFVVLHSSVPVGVAPEEEADKAEMEEAAEDLLGVFEGVEGVDSEEAEDSLVVLASVLAGVAVFPVALASVLVSLSSSFVEVVSSSSARFRNSFRPSSPSNRHS